MRLSQPRGFWRFRAGRPADLKTGPSPEGFGSQGGGPRYWPSIGEQHGFLTGFGSINSARV